MPAKPSYFHRLGDAIEVFRTVNTDWVDRRTVEEVLGVSKTVAWRLMKSCGASEGPGNTIVCGREQLVSALIHLQTSGEFEREARRRDRLSTYLERLAEVGRTRRTTVATREDALSLLNARFDRLPPGVTLTARQLIVDFNSPEQFLQRMGAVIFTLQNDYESVREFIETGIKRH